MSYIPYWFVLVGVQAVCGARSVEGPPCLIGLGGISASYETRDYGSLEACRERGPTDAKQIVDFVNKKYPVAVDAPKEWWCEKGWRPDGTDGSIQHNQLLDKE